MLKILFLDIDGVLNSTRSLLTHGRLPQNFDDMSLFDPCAIGLLKRLCAEVDCKVVISSTWRLHFSVEEFAEKLGIPVIAKTGVGDDRSIEVNDWLLKNDTNVYAIVDDNNWFADFQQKHFVQTESEEGLTYKNYRALFDILGTEEQKKRYLSRLVIF